MIKKYPIFFYLISVISLLSLIISCRKEEVITTPGVADLKANPVLIDLIQKITLHDGSYDNIIDRANCFSVKLPVTVIVDGTTVTVNTTADYDQIKSILEASEHDEDKVEIVFPVTIVLSDYTEVFIANQDQLDSYRDTCNGENEADDDIECVDINFPITINTYNSVTNATNIITIDSDEALYHFVEAIDNYESASLDFPIVVTLYDGTEYTANSIEELKDTIEAYKDLCNEDDNYNYEDDHCDDCSEDDD